VGDNYFVGQTIRGEWFGRDTGELELKGAGIETVFLDLGEGKNP
jgi:hypothetical protein